MSKHQPKYKYDFWYYDHTKLDERILCEYEIGDKFHHNNIHYIPQYIKNIIRNYNGKVLILLIKDNIIINRKILTMNNPHL